MHLGLGQEAWKAIRVAQLPFEFSHPLIETSFRTLKK